jgi:hypothetical protein
MRRWESERSSLIVMATPVKAEGKQPGASVRWATDCCMALSTCRQPSAEGPLAMTNGFRKNDTIAFSLPPEQ